MEHQVEEMERLVGRIEQFRQTTGLSHVRFATRYAEFVGSHKTWEDRLFARAWTELRKERWLPKLRKFVAHIDGAAGQVEIFNTLPMVRHAAFLYDTLQTRSNDRRCAMLVGTQGTGKTLALRFLQRENNFAPIFLSANETWKDSRMRIATALAKSVNAPPAPSASQTFQNAIDVLKGQPTTILIDEAHEGGVLLMKLVKTIINETAARVMLSIYPTAWQRLINGANDDYAEAQQLLRRTLRPVKSDWLQGIRKADFDSWSDAVKLPGLKARSDEMLPRCHRHGNFSLLADALESARVLADERDCDLTPDMFAERVTELCGGKHS